MTGQLNVPIYQAGVEEATVRQAKELHAQAQLNVSVSDLQVRDAVASAWAQFEAAEASIASNEAAEHANEIAFEGVTKEQQVGGRTILDVLNAEQELLNASVALVTAKRNAEVAAFQVLAADGVADRQESRPEGEALRSVRALRRRRGPLDRLGD